MRVWIDNDDKIRQISHKQIRQPCQNRVPIQPTHLNQRVKQTELEVPKKFLGRKCKGRGTKGYASIAMRSSHRTSLCNFTTFVIEVCPHQEFLEGGGDLAWDDKPCGQGSTSRRGE